MKGSTRKLELQLEISTAVHVGSGRELEQGWDFLLSRGNARVIDQEALFARLARGDQDFAALLGPEPKLSDLVEVAGQRPGYTLSPMGRTGGLGRIIREALKDALRRPYIPGSTIKGAIRTAIAARAVDLLSPASMKACLPQGRENPSFAAQELMKMIFGSSPNKDLLRVIHVGDAIFDADSLCLADVRYMNLRHPTGQGRAGWRDMGSGKTGDDWSRANGSYVEALPEASSAPMALQWDDFLLNDVRRWSPKATAAEILPTDLDSLKALLNEHALQRLRSETAFYDAHGVDGAARKCKSLARRIESDTEGGYLQLAWGIGWRGMTGDWLSDETTTSMRNLYRLGKRRKDGRGSWQPWGDFPKTRRLAVLEEPVLPFGWVRLAPRSIDQSGATGSPAVSEPTCDWVEEELERIQVENNCKHDDALRGRHLAESWSRLSEPVKKQQALADIRRRWEAKGWWDTPPPGKKARQARRIYDGE